ncbi:hypothetical protein [Frigoriglobus tundricola]|uniref:hypothetical protein n=1 Tax=Frigoriglobus tundricola TaxID=2774151 RepID=UPI00148EE414|nr:hypothetical protein [Frigoriglobus tundricola]
MNADRGAQDHRARGQRVPDREHPHVHPAVGQREGEDGQAAEHRDQDEDDPPGRLAEDDLPVGELCGEEQREGVPVLLLGHGGRGQRRREGDHHDELGFEQDQHERVGERGRPRGRDAPDPGGEHLAHRHRVERVGREADERQEQRVDDGEAQLERRAAAGQPAQLPPGQRADRAE